MHLVCRGNPSWYLFFSLKILTRVYFNQCISLHLNTVLVYIFSWWCLNWAKYIEHAIARGGYLPLIVDAIRLTDRLTHSRLWMYLICANLQFLMLIINQSFFYGALGWRKGLNIVWFWRTGLSDEGYVHFGLSCVKMTVLKISSNRNWVGWGIHSDEQWKYTR